jgi:hypothetical protein
MSPILRKKVIGSLINWSGSVIGCDSDGLMRVKISAAPEIVVNMRFKKSFMSILATYNVGSTFKFTGKIKDHFRNSGALVFYAEGFTIGG